MDTTWQYLIVFAVIAVCVACTIRFFSRSGRNNGSCHGCALKDNCGKKQKSCTRTEDKGNRSGTTGH